MFCITGCAHSPDRHCAELLQVSMLISFGSQVLEAQYAPSSQLLPVLSQRSNIRAGSWQVGTSNGLSGFVG
jgi:hypothetical protein